MTGPKKHFGRNRPLGSHLVQQRDVVKWHAHIRQIEDSVRAIADCKGYFDRPELTQELDDILADLGTLRGHLPAVQTELPFR